MFSPDTLVKPPQSRHGRGISIVHLVPGDAWGMPGRRVYVKTQFDYCCRPAFRGWRRTPTFLCEYRALSACTAMGLAVPAVVAYRQEGKVAEIVVQEIAGAVPLNTVMQQFTGARRSRVLAHFGAMVGTMHNHGWVHGALGSPHILVQPDADDRVWLIDFDKALPSKRLIPGDLARLWRRTKHLDADDVACFNTAYNKAMDAKTGVSRP